MLLNCGAGEDSWESLGLQGYPPSPSQRKSVLISPGRTDAEAEAEAPILWPPDAKNWLTGKDPESGERLKAGGEWDDRDEMVEWCHRLNVRESEPFPGGGDGQGRLAGCSLCGCKESNMTEWLNWTEVSSAHVSLATSANLLKVKHLEIGEVFSYFFLLLQSLPSCLALYYNALSKLYLTLF